MLSKNYNKVLVALIGLLAILGLTLSFGFMVPRGASTQAATRYMTVQKVFVEDATVGSIDNPSNIRHVADSAENIAEGDFVIMNTQQHQYIDESKVTHTGREAIFISFPGISSSKGIPTVTITYNDSITLKHNPIEESDDVTQQTFTQYIFAITLDELFADNLDYSYFSQYNGDTYDLGNLTTEQRQELSKRTFEGKYSITLTYFDDGSGTDLGGEHRESIEFYITTQKTYNQVNENPTFSDTEKVDAVFDNTNSTLNIYNQMTASTNYFNFNNVDTTYYSAQQRNFIRGRTNASELYCPTLIYNPEKFVVSFTRTLYNYRETTTLDFGVRLTSQNGQTVEIGTLTVKTSTTENPTSVITRVYEVERGTNGFELKLQFDQVGEYVITKTPRLKVGMIGSSVDYITPENNVITANAEYLAPVTLIINGYVANYSNSSTTKSPLYDDTYSYATMDSSNINKVNDVVYAHDFLTESTNEKISITPRTRADTIYTADMTFNNTRFVSNVSTNIVTMTQLKNDILATYPAATDSTAYSYFFKYIQDTNFIRTNASTLTSGGKTLYTDFPSTNQAPVSFDFYGRLYTGTSTNYASWFAYRDTSGNVSVNRYTRGLQFEDAGFYVVYLSYENSIFSLNNQVGSHQYQYMHQIFCFEITNTTPVISILTQEDTNVPTIASSQTATKLGNDAYTNQYVYAMWEKAGPFDADIYCTYNVYNYTTGAMEVSSQPLEGLVYQTDKHSGAQVQVSTNNATMLYGSRKNYSGISGRDGYYQIQVFRSNNNKAYVNYTFNIDTQPISGIQSLQVIGNHLARENGSSEPIVLSELTDGKFNLITKSAFGFTWSDKISGAPITAQYVYASISKSTNYDLVKAITGRDGASEQDAKQILLNMASTGSVYLPTNATLGVFTPAMQYTKIKTDTYEDITATLNSSQIINTAQIAFLLLRDAAGNTAIYSTILDNTNTQVLQVEKQSSYVNVITKDTEFYWGTHKAINATESDNDDPTVISDIFDFVGTYYADSVDKLGSYTWTLNGYTYTSNEIFTKAFYDMDISNTKSLNLAIDRVQIATANGNDIIVEPESVAHGAANWYAVITVEPGQTSTDYYSTRVNIDGIQSDDVYTLTSDEFQYQIFVWDTAQNSNSGGLIVEVNLDKSLGSARSYYEFDGTDLTYNRNADRGEITDRQYVANTYSTNRRYLSFSWTEPGADSSFAIDKITLDFYPYAGNSQSANYPYGDMPTQITLYDSSLGYNATYEYGTIYKITRDSGGIQSTFYQTDILRKLPYTTNFDGPASEAGKYVITRTYKMDSNLDEEIKEDLENGGTLDGDSLTKVYTYFVDRNPILATGSYDYGDIKLQFGYNQGEYPGYPNYPTDGAIIFDNYGLLNTTEGFDRISLTPSDITSTTPSNIITQSNVLPASVNMSYWEDSNYLVYDKYYTDPQLAVDSITDILNKYKNSSRVQIAVQFFANNATSQYALTSQTFYSTRVTEEIMNSNGNYDGVNNLYLYSRPLSDLKNAFTEIGRYRVVLFDLANFEGLLSGDAYTDFGKIGINLSSDSTTSPNNLYPNCSVISFELTGKAPTFDYQVGINSYASVTSDAYESITNESKARISWKDSTDIYSAQLAYNDIYIVKTTIPKGNDTSDTVSAPVEYRQYFPLTTKTENGTFKDPIEITASTTVRDSLVEQGLVKIELSSSIVDAITRNGLSYLDDYINDLTNGGEDDYFFYVENDTLLNAIINNGLSKDTLSDVEFYKVRLSDTSEFFTYYLLLPKSEIEDENINPDKLVDTRYTVTVHYIAKNSEDYMVNGSDRYYSTTRELYVDNTAPYYNLVDMINNDAYINSLGTTFKNSLITNIDNPDSTFLKSYAFAVEPGFTVAYRNKYESNTYFYYRKYTDYTGAKNGQTITSADDDKTGAPVFDRTSPEFVRASYDGISNITPTKFEESGYYDIIEQDQAGNLRVYTIFVTEDEFTINAENGTDLIYLDESNIDGKIFNSEVLSEEDNQGFHITDIISTDLWINIKLSNMMDPTESVQYYYVPNDAVADLPLDSELVSSDIYYIIEQINQFIIDTALAHEDEFGSQIVMTITNRVNLTQSHSFYINTQGKMLISSETDFLNLITINEAAGQFILRLPNTVNIASTKLADLKVFMIENDRTTIQIQYDVNYIPLPTTPEDFESDRAINLGYSFTLANNIVYKFEFTDNFGRRAIYSYPTDSSLVKRIEFTGGTIEHRLNGKTYTYTSNAVDLIYQATGLYVSMYITDLNTNKVLYSKSESDLFDTNNDLFTYTRDSLASNLITIHFNALRQMHNLVHIEVGNGTDTVTTFEFVIYTYYPEIILSDTSGTPIQNNITSKEVMLTWNEVLDALFDPYVEIVYPDGTTERIESGFTVSAEGDYTVHCVNEIGICYSSSVTFTIKDYVLNVYGVYQLVNGDTPVQLSVFSDNYSYITPQAEMTISQYLFLSNDTDWKRNIMILTNEDKDLKWSVVETYGNTRIYRVQGGYLFHIDIYFAVTRIPTLNVSTYTNFRIDNDPTLLTADFKTGTTTITWQTTYTDTSSAGRTYTYPNFFILDLVYNGTFVGSYTSGSVRLTNSGIYTISIRDAVGQKHNFGTRAGSTTFQLTILTNVIYYVNNNAAIPYATYSDAVDFYVPALTYYDYTPNVTFYRNNKPYEITANADGHYTFTTPGVYKVVMTGSIESIIGTTPEAQLSATYQFVIVSPNEAINSYTFSPMAGYEIIEVKRLENDTDITDEIRGDDPNQKITSLYIDKNNLGIGKYSITVRVAENGYIPSQTYTYSIWINNETASLIPSREWGSHSTAPFSITLNTSSVYESIGECHITVNGEVVLSINDSNKNNIDPITITPATAQGDYIIQLVSASGNILQSYRMTIDEPLNTAAIILIVVACVVVLGLVILFVIMRHRVKVR